jgi:autotransporter-associated beta strand protein
MKTNHVLIQHHLFANAAACLLAALALLSARATQAADIFWTDGTDSYTNAAAWGGTVPGGGDNAINNNGSNNIVLINAADPPWTVIDLIAGNADNTSGAYIQNGSTVNVGNPGGWFRFGVNPGSFGIYTLNAGTLNSIDQLHVAEQGVGVLNIYGGTLTKSGGQFSLGDGPAGCFGTVNQTNGVVISSSEIWVGNNPGGSGAYYLSGGALTNSNWFAVGRFGGAGQLTMTGGSFTKTGGGNFYIGENGGTSQFDFSGGTINSDNEFWLANGGGSIATNNMSGTTVLNVNNWVAIGRGGLGVLNLSGGAITKTGNAGNHFLLAAFGGTGIINQTGGSITSTTSDTWMPESGTGIWNLNGGTANLSVVHIGQNSGSIGTLNLNGGVMAASEITTGNAGASSTLNFNGGTLQASADNLNFVHDLNVAQIDAGGAIFDTAGFSITILQSLVNLGGGGVTKDGAGILTLSGANSYVGTTFVNGGKLITTTASTGSGDISVANGAGIGVNVLAANAQLNAANITLASSTAASVDLNLGSFGNPTLAPLNGSGTLAVNGVITVNIADGLPQLGQFPLIKYASRTGSGNFVLGSLPIGIVASIVTNVPNSSIDLNITTVNTPRWGGQAGGTWDIGLTTNWVNAGTGLATVFNNGNPVTFDDNALGTTTVNLVATVSPASITITNNTLAYTLSGTGKISGATSLVKQGTNSFTVATTGTNNYTGPTVISGGTLSVTNLANGGLPSAIGASSANATNLAFGGGTLSYSGPAITINRSYSATATGGGGIDTLNDLTLSGLANGGAGEYRKTGSGLLTLAGVGSNALSGYLASGSRFRVASGPMLLDGSVGGQSNYVRNLSLGLSDGNDTTLTLTNTILDVRNGFSVGDHNNATATLAIKNSTVFQRGNGNVIDIGDNNGNPCSGVITQDGSTLSSDGELWVGQTANGVGSYTLNSGTIALRNWLAIGRAGSHGTFNMTGGTFIKSGNGNFIIGTGAGNNALTSVGTFNHSAGTIHCTNEYWIGENALDIGTNNISGTAVVNWYNWVSIGRHGMGVINFSGGTINRSGNGSAIVVGDNVGGPGNGYINQTGGTLTSQNELWVGQGSSVGQYDLSGPGSVTINNWIAIGRGGGTGTLNMFGGSFTKTGNSGNHFILGAGGPGTINQTGGTITSVLSDTWVGESAPGTWTLNAGSAVLSVVHISQNSGTVGTLSLNGGTLSATEMTTGNTGGNSTLNLNGGTLIAANAANPNFMHDLTTASVMASGAIIDTGTNVINASQALLDGGGGGGLTKNGVGTLRLNSFNTYSGATVVNAGTLGGIGTISGPLSIGAAATLAPGASIGTFTVNANATLSGATVMEISKDGGVPASDLLSVSGNLACGGALNVVLIGTNVLSVNDTFNLFDWGTLSGNFSATNLPAGYLWDTSQLNVNGTIRVSAVSPPRVNPPTLSGGNFILTGMGGPAGASYTWVTSTNVATPIASWTVAASGTFDSSGVASNAVPTNPSDKARFFRLRTP